MLKLKKTNLSQKQSHAIETEQDTVFVEQSIVQENLIKILEKQQISQSKILHHLSSSQFSSISGQQFVKLLSSSLSSKNLQSQTDISTCLQVLQKLISIPHDSKQVKALIKKEKSIDALLLLSLIWKIRHNQTSWKYVAYMIECYPAEMILTGKESVEKWEKYFEDCQEKKRLNQQLKAKIKQFQLFQKLKKQLDKNNHKDFIDTFINL